MIQVCRSISPISKVFQTGTSPVKVLCDDFNEYVCKHSHRTPADILFLEYLAASFGQLWKLKIPEFAFVQIQAEHIPADLTGNSVQPRSFLIPSFGSRNYEFAKEIDASFLSLEDSSKELRKIKNKVDILRIGLFDRWIANEDRHIHNYNLCTKQILSHIDTILQKNSQPDILLDTDIIVYSFNTSTICGRTGYFINNIFNGVFIQ